MQATAVTPEPLENYLSLSLRSLRLCGSLIGILWVVREYYEKWRQISGSYLGLIERAYDQAGFTVSAIFLTVSTSNSKDSAICSMLNPISSNWIKKLRF